MGVKPVPDECIVMSTHVVALLDGCQLLVVAHHLPPSQEIPALPRRPQQLHGHDAVTAEPTQPLEDRRNIPPAVHTVWRGGEGGKVLTQAWGHSPVINQPSPTLATPLAPTFPAAPSAPPCTPPAG